MSKKITIPAVKFQDMVARSVKGASENKLLPITSMMCIEMKNNVLTLTTTDTANTLKVRADKIPIFSYCEHHLALMYNMEVSVAYIPNGKVIGLSKVARVADMVGKRLQLQERIGEDIAYILMKILGTDNVMVVIQGEHSCMTARGIKSRGSRTKTATLKGVFNTDSDLRGEVYNLIK